MAQREVRHDLVVRARGGDRAALSALMTSAAPVVAALVGGLAPWLRDREDVVQEVLLRAMTHLRRVKDPARFGAYLNEITRNLVYDMSRRARRRRALPDDWPANERDDPAQRAVDREARERVRAALCALGDADRQVVLLRHWAGLSYEEIAQTVGSTVSSVQSRLFRARRELRERLDGGSVGER